MDGARQLEKVKTFSCWWDPILWARRMAEPKNNALYACPQLLGAALED